MNLSRIIRLIAIGILVLVILLVIVVLPEMT